jgi:hypothetical protein
VTGPAGTAGGSPRLRLIMTDFQAGTRAVIFDLDG